MCPNPGGCGEEFPAAGQGRAAGKGKDEGRACTPLIWPQGVLMSLSGISNYDFFFSSGMKNTNVFHLSGFLVL